VAAKLNWARRKQPDFLAGYAVLLLVCFGSSVVKVGVWLFVGLTSLACFCVFPVNMFVHHKYRYHRKRLNDELLDKGCMWEEKPESMNDS
jgi:hypothetical protein